MLGMDGGGEEEEEGESCKAMVTVALAAEAWIVA